MSRPALRRTPIPAALLVLSVALAGCLGSPEPAPTGPEAPFGSFEEALAADGPTFKPAGTDRTETGTQEGQVDSLDYQARHPFEVTSDDADAVVVEVRLDAGMSGAEIDVVLEDADGNAQASATLDADSSQATLEAEQVPGGGEWAVAVSGQGLDGAYTLDIAVHYPSTHPLTVKVLEPEGLPALSAGVHDLVFLLYDAEAEAPVTDAEVAVESWAVSMGHGTDGETDPVHLAHGIHQGEINPSMSATWEIRIDVATAEGEEVRFAILAEVT